MTLLSVYVSSGMRRQPAEDKDHTSAIITRLHSTQVILSHGPSNCVLITEDLQLLINSGAFEQFSLSAVWNGEIRATSRRDGKCALRFITFVLCTRATMDVNL